jgi:hypothetical protein
MDLFFRVVAHGDIECGPTLGCLLDPTLTLKDHRYRSAGEIDLRNIDTIAGES